MKKDDDKTLGDVRIPRRRLLQVGSAGVLGMLLAPALPLGASAQDKKLPDIKNVKANLKKLKMGEFNPNYATQWSYRLAWAHGFLKEHGIEDLEVILSEEYIPGLVGGSLDVTHGDTNVFFGSAQASGLPIKEILIHRHKEYWIMGVRKGIDKPADLKGAKITGGPLDGRNTWIQKQLLADMGLDPEKDVQFVPTSGGSDKRFAALINGTVDAASVFPRHEDGLKKSGGKFLAKKAVSAPQEGFASMGGWLSKNEDTAFAFVLADLKARQWLFKKENREKAYSMMRELGFEIPPAFEAQYEVELEQLSPDGGFESAEAMDKFVAQLAETGDVPKGVDWRKYMDLTYLWAAQDALGIPRRPAKL